MSFDIFYLPCRFDEKETQFTDRLTGEVRSCRKNQPLTAADLESVKELLNRVNARIPDGCAFYSVDFPDGGSALIFSSTDMQRGWMVALRGITADVLAFLLELARVGNMLFRPAMEEVVNVVPSVEHLKKVPSDWENLVACDSPGQLGIILSRGFSAWKRYRDQVCE
jgi:hypothetical protein